MATNSEIITLIESSKIFLPSFCYMGIKVKQDKQEKELCDCLIEFKNCYVIIQVKERSNNSNSNNEDSWYEKKILKNARSQIKDTIDFLHDDNCKFFINKGEIILDRRKKILPIIIFDNDRLNDYKRVIYSNGIDRKINIFSINDFKIMLDAIKIPYDIIGYLKFREVLFEQPNLLDTRLAFDNVNERITLLNKINNEQDFAFHYLFRTYMKDLNNNETIKFYNFILNEIDKIDSSKKFSLLNILLSADHKEADSIAKMFVSCIDRCDNVNLYKPEYVILDDSALLIYSNNGKYSDQEYQKFVRAHAFLFAYKYQINDINVLVVKKDNDKCFIEFYFPEYDLKKDEELDKRVKLI